MACFHRFAKVSRGELETATPHGAYGSDSSVLPPAQLIKGLHIWALFARLERRLVVITDDADDDAVIWPAVVPVGTAEMRVSIVAIAIGSISSVDTQTRQLIDTSKPANS